MPSTAILIEQPQRQQAPPAPACRRRNGRDGGGVVRMSRSSAMSVTSSILPCEHLREPLGDLPVPILRGMLVELCGHRG